MNPFLEHAARVLEHQPTRSMEAEPLYRRAARESGISLPFPRFMEAIRERTEQFAVIAADPVLGAAADWNPRQRSLYQAALDAAGLTQPLVVLTEPLHEPVERPPGADGVADVLADVHAALTHLLRSSDPDDPLHVAAVCGMDELIAVRRALGA
ncbi:MAG TPA: hypothetical protein VFZ69_11730 [Longimicrobiales bacterium]